MLIRGESSVNVVFVGEQLVVFFTWLHNCIYFGSFLTRDSRTVLLISYFIPIPPKTLRLLSVMHGNDLNNVFHPRHDRVTRCFLLPRCFSIYVSISPIFHIALLSEMKWQKCRNPYQSLNYAHLTSREFTTSTNTLHPS